MEELLNLLLGTLNEILWGNKVRLLCGINSRVDEVILKRDLNINDYCFLNLEIL